MCAADVLGERDVVLLTTHRGELPELTRLTELRPLPGQQALEVLLDDRQGQIRHLGDRVGLGEPLDAQGVKRAEERIGGVGHRRPA